MLENRSTQHQTLKAMCGVACDFCETSWKSKAQGYFFPSVQTLTERVPVIFVFEGGNKYFVELIEVRKLIHTPWLST